MDNRHVHGYCGFQAIGQCNRRFEQNQKKWALTTDSIQKIIEQEELQRLPSDSFICGKCRSRHLNKYLRGPKLITAKQQENTLPSVRDVEFTISSSGAETFYNGSVMDYHEAKESIQSEQENAGQRINQHSPTTSKNAFGFHLPLSRTPLSSVSENSCGLHDGYPSNDSASSSTPKVGLRRNQNLG